LQKIQNAKNPEWSKTYVRKNTWKNVNILRKYRIKFPSF